MVLTAAMLEGMFTLDIISYSLSAAAQFVLIGEQALQSDWTARVQLAIADSQFGAQTIAESVSKARGGIMKHAGSIHFIHEPLCHFAALGKDALSMAGAIVVDVFNGLVNVAHNSNCNF